MNWRTLLLIVVVGVVALSMLFNRQRKDDAPAAQSAAPAQPAYHLIDATLVEIGPTGVPLYRMSAQRIEQNLADQSIRLNDLKLSYHPNPTQDWTLTAANGFIPANSRTVDLRGNVEIVGRPAPNSMPATVQTSRLLVDMNANTAKTQERVDFVWGAHRLTTQGMAADLNTGRLQLESAVHGRFVR